MKTEFNAENVKVTETMYGDTPQRKNDTKHVVFDFSDGTSYRISPHPYNKEAYIFAAASAFDKNGNLKANEFDCVSKIGEFTEYGTVYPVTADITAFKNILPYIVPKNHATPEDRVSPNKEEKVLPAPTVIKEFTLI